MIVEGYKGVMDLDLTNVDSKLHKIMIIQHYKDIEDYKIEQSKLDPEKRYDNTIGKALVNLEYENKLRALRFNKVESNNKYWYFTLIYFVNYFIHTYRITLSSF